MKSEQVVSEMLEQIQHSLDIKLMYFNGDEGIKSQIKHDVEWVKCLSWVLNKSKLGVGERMGYIKESEIAKFLWALNIKTVKQLSIYQKGKLRQIYGNFDIELVELELVDNYDSWTQYASDFFKESNVDE